MKWSVGAGLRRNGWIADSRINCHGTDYTCSYRIDGSIDHRKGDYPVEEPGRHIKSAHGRFNLAVSPPG